MMKNYKCVILKDRTYALNYNMTTSAEGAGTAGLTWNQNAIGFEVSFAKPPQVNTTPNTIFSPIPASAGTAAQSCNFTTKYNLIFDKSELVVPHYFKYIRPIMLGLKMKISVFPKFDNIDNLALSTSGANDQQWIHLIMRYSPVAYASADNRGSEVKLNADLANAVGRTDCIHKKKKISWARGRSSRTNALTFTVNAKIRPWKALGVPYSNYMDEGLFRHTVTAATDDPFDTVLGSIPVDFPRIQFFLHSGDMLLNASYSFDTGLNNITGIPLNTDNFDIRVSYTRTIEYQTEGVIIQPEAIRVLNQG